MRIAIVHPWFLAHGGAEHTANVLAKLFPQADIVTLLYNEADLPDAIRGRKIVASGLNWLPWKYHLYRFLMPIYAYAFESLDLRGYDLVISSDSCVAKGVLIDQHARHICYCHSPMRALWDGRYEFRALLPAPLRPLFSWVVHRLRAWDFLAAQRVDHFVANSNYVAERIQRYYRRDSRIIYPPVDLQSHEVLDSHDDFYLSAGRLTETKRVDLLIEACNRLGRRLIVVGGGRHTAALKKIAGPTIEFAGRAPDEELDRLYSRCRALLFASDEDFGIVPVEAQGYGRPVIAFGHGGSLETVIGVDESAYGGRRHTGVYFPKQTTESVMDAIVRFEAQEESFDPRAIRRHAERFSTPRFHEQFSRLVSSVIAEMNLEGPGDVESAKNAERAFRFEGAASPTTMP